MNRKGISLFGWLLCGLLVAGCGYRAPMYLSDVPEATRLAACPGVHGSCLQLAEILRRDTGFAPRSGNTVTLLPEGPQRWKMFVEDLQQARQSIYIDVYIFKADSLGQVVADLLREKACSGVDVRVILEQRANTPAHKKALARLLADSVAFSLIRVPAHRDHRKLVLIDGQVAYMGGRNIKDDYVVWRDADIRITGPAVADLSAVYMENQQRAAPSLSPVFVAEELETAALTDRHPREGQITNVTIQIVPESPTDKILPIRNCFEWALQNARRYFWFYNPYSPPPASTLQALKDAAARGVDVRWIVPAVNDVTVEKWVGESLYKELLAAGVRIFEWQDRMMHAKQFMTDDCLLAIGSANMDNLSFFVNFELEALLYDADATRYAARIFRSDLENNCREITQGAVQDWSVLRRLRNRLTRVIIGPMG